MSQNNNQSYSHGYQYGNNQLGNLTNNQQTQSITNNNQVNKPVNAPLLPYHEYLALQKKNSNPSNTPLPSTNMQQSPQAYTQNIRQPYYYPPNNNYQAPINAYQYPNSLPQYNYYPQPLPQAYNQPYNYYNQPYNPTFYNQSASQSQIKSQTELPISNNIGPNSGINDINKPNQLNNKNIQQSIRHSPSPIKNNIINKQSFTNQSRNSPKPQQKQFNNQRNNQYNKNNNNNKTTTNNNNKPNNYNKDNNYTKPYKPNNSNYQYQRKHRQQQQDYGMQLSSNQEWSQQEQEQQIFQKYQYKKYNNKNKNIKKKDPVQDSPDQIKKWIQARKRNYPGLKKRLIKQNNNQLNNNNNLSNQTTNQINDQQQKQRQKQQMSKLQSKIRKKLLIINGDTRNIMKKIKNIQILRRIVQDPNVLKKQRRNKLRNNQPNKYNQDAKTQSKLVNKIQEKLQKQVQKQIQIIKPIEQQKVQEIEQVQKPQKEIKQDNQSSQSEQSIQPEQVPANKIPKHIIQDGQIQEQKIIDQDKFVQQEKQITHKINQINSSNKLMPTQLFQFVQKQPSINQLSKPQPLAQKPSQLQSKQFRQPKSFDPQTIIAHLRQKQKQDRQSLDTLFDYKSNSYSYNYRVQTLQTSLKLDQIFAQTTYLLQAIRYIVKQNFFEDKQ